MPVVAVDVGGTYIRIAEYDPMTGSVQGLVQRPHGARGTTLPPERLLNEVRSFLEVRGTATALGISVAGVVDRATGRVVRALNLGWQDVELRDLLERGTGLPVALDSDAFCGALAEMRWGEARDASGALYVTIGTGIGHAWLLNGQLWRGSSAAANIFGHLTVVPQGAPCYCGKRGCLCQYASGPGLVRVANERAGREVVREPREILRQAEVGAKWARETLEFALRLLALALSHAVTLGNPSTVILAGGVVSDRWPRLDALAELVGQMVHPEVRSFEIRRSSLGVLGSLVGAGILATESRG